MRCPAAGPGRRGGIYPRPVRLPLAGEPGGRVAVSGRPAERLIRISAAQGTRQARRRAPERRPPARRPPDAGASARRPRCWDRVGEDRGRRGRPPPTALREQTIGAGNRRLGDRLGLALLSDLASALSAIAAAGRRKGPAAVPAQVRGSTPQRARDRGCPVRRHSTFLDLARTGGGAAPAPAATWPTLPRGGAAVSSSLRPRVALPYLVRGRLGWASGFGQRRRWRRERALSAFGPAGGATAFHR